MSDAITFKIGPHAFALGRASDSTPTFESWPEGWNPLCQVIETAWAYSPARFLKSVLAHAGQSFEGEVSYAYHEEFPEEIAEGVALDFLGESQNVSTEQFDELVARYARAAMALPREKPYSAEVHELVAQLVKRCKLS